VFDFEHRGVGGASADGIGKPEIVAGGLIANLLSVTNPNAGPNRRNGGMTLTVKGLV